MLLVLLCERDPFGVPAARTQQLPLSKKNFGGPKGVSAETVETPLDPLL